MMALECIKSAFSSLRRNKLRSFLTMLGIIIGVGSVITLTSIGEGIKSNVSKQVESLGANLIYVFPGKFDKKVTDEKKSKLGISKDMFASSRSPLVYQDVLDLKGKEHIMAVTGVYIGIENLDLLNIYVSSTGVDEDFLTASNIELDSGRFFNKEEIQQKTPVAVIGEQVKKEVFNGENPINKKFKLNGKEYKVIGLLKYKKPENMGPASEDLNVKIYLPITELIDRNKEKNISRIVISAPSSNEVAKAETIVQNILGKKHSAEQFSVMKQQDMINTVSEILNMLNAALGGIAGISLIVGGVGIMNIMLVSVIERTREIGIRKAVGARKLHILIQFIIESVTISLIGATIGLITGVFLAKIIPNYFPLIPTKISDSAVLVSIVFSFVIGVFFGVYPALKAAKLDPVAALRSE